MQHQGNPTGKFDTIGGVRCYRATPSGDYPKQKVVLYFSDIFGIDLVDSQRICDDLARNGFQVVAVDLHGGDPVSVQSVQSGSFDLRVWLSRHGPEVTRPLIDNVIAALGQQGVTEFAATGYCFSARYVFDLAFDGIIKVAAITHPATLNLPEDLHKFKRTNVPLLINSCEIDQMFPIDAQDQADAILGAGLTKTDLYRREYFAGCRHGFAIRGDVSDPKVKAGKEGAFRAIVEFFSHHF